MDPHPSSKSSSTLASLLEVTVATLVTQEVASFACNEKSSTERKFTVNEVTRPAADKIIDRSTLLLLFPSLQRFMEDRGSSEFLPSLYAELLSQRTGPYDGVP